MPGPTLGRYRLVERLLEPLASPTVLEARSELWRGVDVGLGGLTRPVAVERLAPSLTSDRALAADVSRAFLVSHRNLVAVRDAGELDGQLFVAWEWVDGAPLQTLLERLSRAHRPLPLRFGCWVTIETARGLDQAHRARDAAGQLLEPGLVHADVGPDRQWISLEGEVKLAGLGLGRARPLDGGRRWLAPEQARGEPIDGRADVFALGATLYELASGQNPFGRPVDDPVHDAAHDHERMARLRAGICPPLRALQSALPEGLEAIVLRAMAPARDDRYPSCAQLREDLEAFARREGYALSQSDFAPFVRELLAAPAAGSTAAATATAKRLSGSRAVAAPPVPSPTRAAATGADGAPSRASPNSDMTDVIPRQDGLGALWLSTAAVALMLLGGVALAILRPFRSTDGPPRTTAAPPSAAAATPTTTAATPTASSTPAASSFPSPSGDREHHVRTVARPAEAHLTITADVAADAFIDGSYVRPTPIVDLELPPGRHVVRVESTAPGPRLIPRQETIELHPGELKELQMMLQ
jgi:hypothetical protein